MLALLLPPPPPPLFLYCSTKLVCICFTFITIFHLLRSSVELKEEENCLNGLVVRCRLESKWDPPAEITIV